MKLILASTSPRRRQLLELIGLPFDVVPSTIDEVVKEGEDPRAYARRAAQEKALDVSERRPGQPVLGADTVVEIDDAILGKPRDDLHAHEMLRALSGRKHRVHTAVALTLDKVTHDLVDTSEVELVALDEGMIRWYVETGEPLDKAGAYAVQGIAGVMVAGVEGSPHTVVGLPMHRLPELFAQHGLEFWSELTPG